MYLTTTISVAMVLLLVGLECVLLLSANSLVHQVRENATVEILLKQNTDTAVSNRLMSMLNDSKYCRDCRYISAQEALNEHIRYLGEDPSKFLGYNPLSASCEMHLKSDYANADSIAVIEAQLLTLPYVDKVVYQKDLITILNRNISELSMILLAVAVLLLIVSLALMGNTIRLQIYSKRFLINTMTLVGATSWMIKAPIVSRNVGIGFIAALLALLGIAGAVYYINVHMGVLLFALTWENIAFVVGTVVLSGVLITLIASLFATGRYIRMKADTMYEI